MLRSSLLLIPTLLKGDIVLGLEVQFFLPWVLSKLCGSEKLSMMSMVHILLKRSVH